jgi:glycosyltransferase involved in cell wall biosynthesis
MPLRFSIVVPTRNRAVLLERCLLALGELEYPRDEYEVLVVDDGSEPGMEGVVARFAGALRVRCLRAEGGGPAAARNMALRVAEGEYVAFTDDDCRPDAGWLRAFDRAIAGLVTKVGGSGDSLPQGLKPLADGPLDVRAEARTLQGQGDIWAEVRTLQGQRTGFGGRIVDSPANSIYGRSSQMLVSFLYEYNERADGLRFFCSNNLVFPKQALLAMGGFDESFPLAAAEDRYICARWLRDGELVFVPEAVVEHRQMLGFQGFMRQQFRYGRGACQFWRRRMTEERAKNRVLPGEFYARMLAYPFGRVGFFEAVATSLLLALSQASVAAGYYWERSRNGRAEVKQAAAVAEGSGTPDVRRGR